MMKTLKINFFLSKKGHFGEVKVCTRVNTNLEYAIKIVKKH